MIFIDRLVRIDIIVIADRSHHEPIGSRDNIGKDGTTFGIRNMSAHERCTAIQCHACKLERFLVRAIIDDDGICDPLRWWIVAGLTGIDSSMSGRETRKADQEKKHKRCPGVESWNGVRAPDGTNPRSCLNQWIVKHELKKFDVKNAK